MNLASRHILILLQVVALVMFPQIAVFAHDDKPMTGMEAGAPANHHGHSHSHDKIAGHHDHELVQSGAASDIHAGTMSKRSPNGELICHPCCVGGKGACIAIMTALPGVPVPPLVGSIETVSMESFWSRSVPPRPHPPNLYS